MPLFDLSDEESAKAYFTFLKSRPQGDFNTLEGLKTKARSLDYAIVDDDLFVAEGYEDGVLGTVFSQMVDWLATADLEEGKRIDGAALGAAATAGFVKEPPEHVFLKALFWLSTGWGDLMDTQFVYIDDAGAEHEVSKAVVGMLDDKAFTHPVTGEVDPYAAAKTFMRFSPSAKLLALRAGRAWNNGPVEGPVEAAP